MVSPQEGTLIIDHRFRPDETDPAKATAILAFGFTAPPAVKLNGTTLTKLATVTIDGKTAYVIPLGEQLAPAKDLPGRYAAMQTLLKVK